MSVVDGMLGVRRIPEGLREPCSLPTVHYADAFTLTTDVEAPAESWARAMFGDVPTPAEVLIWRGLLGMRLDRGRSPETVAGWRIAGRGEDWIRLEAASWWIAGNFVVRTSRGRVSLGTFLHYRQPLGHLAWPPLSALHRHLVPGVLRGAAHRVAAKDQADDG